MFWFWPNRVLHWHAVCIFFFFLLTLVAEPLLSHLTVSNVTSGSVAISWKAQESAFDSFLVEVRNSDPLQETVVHSLPAASRSFVITNLKASSDYTAHLHGLIGRQHAQTLMVQATTGISHDGLFTVWWTSSEEDSPRNHLRPTFHPSIPLDPSQIWENHPD